MPAFLVPKSNENPLTSALIRDHDWESTTLGPMNRWPSELRTLVRLMLRSKAPQHLVWGEGHCLLYNDGYIPLLGIKHPAALGAPFLDVWPEVRDEVEPLVVRTLAGESSYFEDRSFLLMRGGDGGQQSWVSFAYTPVEDEAGNIVGLHSLFFETTSKVLAERGRMEETERLRAMFDQAPGFIAVLTGPEHVFTLTNHAYAQFVGHRPVLGLPVRQAMPEVVGQGFIELLDSVYNSGRPYVGRRVPVNLQREPGARPELLYADFVYQPLLDAAGAVTGVFVQGSDVTGHLLAEDELRGLSDELRRSNQRKDEFLATLAHELRNPLAPIRTGLEVLALSPTPERAAQTREVMDRQLGHMVRLIDDLLDIARINSNKIELRHETVSVADLVGSALEASRPAIDAAHHQLFVSLPSKPLYVRVDPTRISQVISNLLNNAAKYTPPQGRVSISVKPKGGDVLICVDDNGVGIAPDALPHVFELFSQNGGSQGHAQGGLGIGLALVKRITEMHAGTVEAHSDGAGCGSTFTLCLPDAALPAEGAGDASDTGAGTGTAAAPMRILVVDDNVDAAETMRWLLEMLGHEVQVVHDGASALAAADAMTPALIFLDIGLPDITGFEVAQRIRASHGPDAPVIVAVTGWGAPSDVERAGASGFDHHMTKPVDPRRVEAMVAELQARG